MQSENELKVIGNNIRQIRLNKNIELKEVANKMELTPQAYGNIENGKTDISFSQASKLSIILEEHISSILNIETNTINNFHQTNNSGICLQHTHNFHNVSEELMNKFMEIVKLIKKS